MTYIPDEWLSTTEPGLSADSHPSGKPPVARRLAERSEAQHSGLHVGLRFAQPNLRFSVLFPLAFERIPVVFDLRGPISGEIRFWGPVS